MDKVGAKQTTNRVQLESDFAELHAGMNVSVVDPAYMVVTGMEEVEEQAQMNAALVAVMMDD